MSTNTTRRGNPRTPWLLPVLLALIIVLVILGVLFGSRIKNALSSPTATPQPARTVVVTATPGGPTPTSGGSSTTLAAGAEATATPSTNTGVVTPLPNTTPVPTVVGLQLGMITRPQNYVTATQSKVDAKTPGYGFYVSPRGVVQNNLPHFGFTQGFTIVAPNPSPTPTPMTSVEGRPEVKFVVQYQSKLYTVVVVQPGKRGPTGIWSIVTILAGRQ